MRAKFVAPAERLVLPMTTYTATPPSEPGWYWVDGKPLELLAPDEDCDEWTVTNWESQEFNPDDYDSIMYGPRIPLPDELAAIRELVEASRPMFEAAQSLFGEDDCDCPPEGHHCGRSRFEAELTRYHHAKEALDKLREIMPPESTLEEEWKALLKHTDGLADGLQGKILGNVHVLRAHERTSQWETVDGYEYPPWTLLKKWQDADQTIATQAVRIEELEGALAPIYKRMSAWVRDEG